MIDLSKNYRDYNETEQHKYTFIFSSSIQYCFELIQIIICIILSICLLQNRCDNLRTFFFLFACMIINLMFRQQWAIESLGRFKRLAVLKCRFNKIHVYPCMSVVYSANVTFPLVSSRFIRWNRFHDYISFVAGFLSFRIALSQIRWFLLLG